MNAESILHEFCEVHKFSYEGFTFQRNLKCYETVLRLHEILTYMLFPRGKVQLCVIRHSQKLETMSPFEWAQKGISSS
jgi:hypothetical protein